MISLKKLKIGDLNHSIMWMNSDLLYSLQSHKHCLSIDEHKKWFFDMIKDPTQIQKGIFLNEAYIGNIGLKNINWNNKSGELIVYIGDEGYRGRGYGTKAIVSFIKCCFNELKLHKIKLNVLSENKIAVKSYRNAGFFIEAELKDEFIWKGYYKNITRMAIINE